MLTPEERLTTLEKTVALLQKSSSTSTQDLSRNLTMLLDIVSSQQMDIKEIKISQVTVEERLDMIERRIESGFETLGKRLATLENRFGILEKKFDQMLHVLTTFTDQSEQEQ